MVPDRIEHYKDHEIRIFVLRPISDEMTFRATYEIHLNGSKHVVAGTIAGAFSTARAAEEGALEAGKFSIDEKGGRSV